MAGSCGSSGAADAFGAVETDKPGLAADRGLTPEWPLPLVTAALAGGAALLGAGMAWGLQQAVGLPAGWAAASGAALAVLASALPTLALALQRLHLAGQAAAAAPVQATAPPPVRDRDTGAYRRDVFMELADREWARARRYGSGAGLLVVDLDRHGALAETHGPALVDVFLNTLTRQTSPTLRGPDLMTRLGPAQLGVFLTHADTTGALDVAERIRECAETLELPWPAPAQAGQPSQALVLRCTVSVGVAPLRPAHLNLQALLQDALDALNLARLAGGNCVRAAPVDETPGGSWQR
jgi:diguanylate cyclase (GGDEF)-like protein